MQQFFYDLPGRKDTYICVNLWETFPKRFFPTRWTENGEVVSRAIKIWDNFKRVMEEFESLAQSKRPKNQSNETLLQHSKDPSVVIKFRFFQEIHFFQYAGSFLKNFSYR